MPVNLKQKDFFLIQDYLPHFFSAYWDTLTWVDLLLLAVVLASTLWGWARGMIQELFGLIGWALAFWAARFGAPWLVPHLNFVHQETLRWGAAFLGIFLVVLVLLKIASTLLQSLVRHIGLIFVDGLLGATFGLLRGLLLDMVLMLLAGLTSLPHQPEWTHSRYAPYAMAGTQQLLRWLPRHLTHLFHY